MPRRCTICTHPERAEIEKQIVTGISFRDISKRFDIGVQSIHRHKTSHLGRVIERAERQHAIKVERAVAKREESKDSDAFDVIAELKEVFVLTKKMLYATDDWLTDPNNPKVYDLGPRAHEVMVTYEEVVDYRESGTPITKRRKATLQQLLDRIKAKMSDEITIIESKSADPRRLHLETAAQLKSSLELMAKLLGQLDERPQINILVTPEWLTLKTALFAALSQHPEARRAVAQQFRAIGGADV